MCIHAFKCRYETMWKQVDALDYEKGITILYNFHVAGLWVFRPKENSSILPNCFLVEEGTFPYSFSPNRR